MTLQAPKGTRDFYPDDMRVQNHLFNIWRQACLNFGFEEYEGPTFENLELFTEKSGQEIVTQLYNFKDKGDRDIALRPEMTPTLARMVNQKGNSLKLPLRWFSIPRLFRYEKSQRGRLREFFQLNMDIIGCEGIAAEVDLLSAIIEMLKQYGLGPEDFSIQVSSRRLLSEFLDRQGLPAEKKNPVYAALDKRAKIGEEEFRKLLEKEGLSTASVEAVEAFFNCQSLAELKVYFPESVEPAATTGLDAANTRLDAVSSIEDSGANAGTNAPKTEMPKNGLSELEKLFEYMQSLGYGEYLRLDLSVVRGLAYYTGIVFEVYDRAKSNRAIAGGGRYDNLLSSLGGLSLTGVGFGMGDVVLCDLLREKGLLPKGRDPLDYFLLDVSPGEDRLPNSELLRLAQTLRGKGFRVGYSLAGEKFKKQMNQANDQGAKSVLFFGSDKAPAGQFEVKDMRSGEQKIVGIEAL
jgi:histidyl-tRNA synthetase